MMAAMGFGGFGKKKTKTQLDPKRFDKGKREEVIRSVSHRLTTFPPAHAASQAASGSAATPTARAEPGNAPSSSNATGVIEPEYDPDEPGPPPPPARPTTGAVEPEYDPSEFDDDDDDAADDDDGSPSFPATHELLLKDHSKVVSALALDPSGARVLSGSHDYDCKLWDFGGMDWRCKPFKTWEPSGTYYVRIPVSRACMQCIDLLFRCRSTISSIRTMGSGSSWCRGHCNPSCIIATGMSSAYLPPNPRTG